MKLFDAHCHLDDPRIVHQSSSHLEAARSAGVRRFVLAGYSPERWPQQQQIVSSNTDCFATYGLHPWFVAEEGSDGVAKGLASISAWLDSEESSDVVGVGEFGLDRSSPELLELWELQVEVFRALLGLARERNLPIVLHIVRAHNEALALLKGDGLPKAGGMVHGFSGSLELAQLYVRLGLKISVGGAVTFPNRKKLRRAVASLESVHLLSESDSPDQAPHAWKEEWNEPSSLSLIVPTMAAIRDEDSTAFAAQLYSNSLALFALEE